jgi:Rrf2 family protein
MPTLGKNVEYALHSLVYFVGNPKGSTITIHDLSRFQNISETYLAKAFTKLKKAGIVKSNIGVKGGFSLGRSPEEITFLDVVLAVEGEISFFECNGIRENCILVDPNNSPWVKGEYCTIHKVMIETENKIKDALRQKNLQWLFETIRKESKSGLLDKSKIWFDNNVFNSK